MAPRRSGRRNVSPYKKGDYIEYQYKGQTVTGKLFKKSPNSTEAKPIWIVTPSDRRRKNEDIPEKALGKVINAQEAMNNRGPKLKKSNKTSRDSPSPTNSNSDGSLDEEPQAPKRKGGRGGSSPSDDNSRSSTSNNKKRKSDDSNISGSDRANKKSVTFSQESNTSATGGGSNNKKKFKLAKKGAKGMASTRIGTRSSRGSGEMVLLPELPIKRQFKAKQKKVKKDENVTVVKMLTGTLYLYRGDRPRAEFVRSK